MDFLFSLVSTLLFLSLILGLFFLPGFFVLRFVLRLSNSSFETALFSFALSIGLIDLSMLLLDRGGLPLTPPYIGGSLFLSLFLVYVLARLGRFYHWWGDAEAPVTQPFRWSRMGAVIFLLFLVLTMFIRGLYLHDAGLPTSTDLGHHLYWAKLITETGSLPPYQKIGVELDALGQPFLSPPRPIADFIIGEHLPFSALALFGRFDFTSAAPLAFLLLVNLLSVLAVALLSLRMARSWFGEENHRSAERVFLATFLLLGPLYALASPQAKFVSGGVVGNVFGNLFIPIILLAFFSSFEKKRAVFFGLGLFLSFILAFTHHLSTLVLSVVLFGFFLFSLALPRNSLLHTLREWFHLFARPSILLHLGLIALFLFFVAQPTYLDRSVIDSAIGTPTKTTRTGLSFAQVSSTVGFVKIALGLGGLLLIALTRHRRTIAGSMALAWSGLLLLMSLAPEILFLDIPSNRIGSYLVYPLALTGGVFLVFLAEQFRVRVGGKMVGRLPSILVFSSLAILLVTLASNGSYENAQSLPSSAKASALGQTFAVSQYLAERVSDDDIILKDHNYVTADAWMKLFFLRDYGYPLSRGFFSRYSEGGSRSERCTLDMISIPNVSAGKKCFEATGVNLVVVHPGYDATQFEKSREFVRWYESPLIHVYERRPTKGE